MEKIEILINKSNWIVVNKPAGLSVHNNEDPSNLLSELETMGYACFAPINRLDKETSGIMVLSSEASISTNLQKALNSKKCEKVYLALVKGRFLKDQINGSWKSELTNKAEGRKNPQGVKAERVPCATSFEILKSNKYLSYLRLILESGRQHQIRKHSVLDKHQIVGDKRYGDVKYNSLIQKTYKFKGMALHSHKLSFEFGGDKYCFEKGPPSSWQAFDLIK